MLSGFLFSINCPILIECLTDKLVVEQECTLDWSNMSLGHAGALLGDYCNVMAGATLDDGVKVVSWCRSKIPPEDLFLPDC
jgi:hypothetical protein